MQTNRHISTNRTGSKCNLWTRVHCLEKDGNIDLAPEYSGAYMRRLRWKIGLSQLPLMWFRYGTQQADKTSLGTQAVFGIREDTNVVGDQFNWLSTAFYLSYMACVSLARIMQKCHTRKFLSIVVVLWSIVILFISFAKNFTRLIVLRTLQGGLECATSPMFMLMTGAWYTSRSIPCVPSSGELRTLE